VSSDDRADRLAQVQSQVTYHRQRLALYRRLHGSRPSERLRDLEVGYLSAQDRLARCTATTGGRQNVVETLPPRG
jgi:hypothetical protein